MNAGKPAVVLLSGGLDSAVALACCRRDGFTPYALTIDYGQRHRLELDAASRVAKTIGVSRHIVLSVDLTQWGGSALTSNVEVPTERTRDDMSRGVPSTYVPARNTIFLSLAMGWAEALGTGDIYIGAHAVDYSGYPDCRPEFFDAFSRMADLATKSGVEGQSHWKIHTPLLQKSKSEIIRLGLSHHVPFEQTLSCYQPTPKTDGYVACGRCDACIIRRDAFIELGVDDPTPYVAQPVAQQ